MGTPEFAVPCLKSLYENGYEISAVVTQPDKPSGRGEKLSVSPVKKYAQDNKIKVLQPVKVKTDEFFNEINDIKPDVMVTCAYGKILDEKVLGIPRFGCINIHASLLPKLRGPAPMRWSIINGDDVSGITSMYTDAGMDTGDILLTEKVRMTNTMTYGQLHDIMSDLGSKVILKTLDALKNGTITRIKQNDGESSYAPAIKKEISHIDWNNKSQNIYNLYRGMSPSPGTYSYCEKKRIKVWAMEIQDEHFEGKIPGTIVDVSKNGILVATKDGTINITEIQVDSGKRMTVESYLCGHDIAVGEILD